MMEREMEGSARVATPYDAAEYLETEDDVAAYLDAARETGDSKLFEAALEDAAHARSRMRRARDTQHTDVLPSDSWHEVQVPWQDSIQQTRRSLYDAQLAGLTYLQDIPRHRMDEAVQTDFQMERCQNHRACSRIRDGRHPCQRA